MKEKHPILYEILDFAKMILFSFIFVLLLTNFIIRPVQVMGPSMHPTLKNEEMALRISFL